MSLTRHKTWAQKQHFPGFVQPSQAGRQLNMNSLQVCEELSHQNWFMPMISLGLKFTPHGTLAGTSGAILVQQKGWREAMKMQLAHLVTRGGVLGWPLRRLSLCALLCKSHQTHSWKWIRGQRAEGGCNTQLGTCTAVGMPLAAENRDSSQVSAKMKQRKVETTLKKTTPQATAYLLSINLILVSFMFQELRTGPYP